jgi:hypothetical protein
MGTILDIINFRSDGNHEQATITDPFLIRVYQQAREAQIRELERLVPAKTLCRDIPLLNLVLRKNPHVKTERPRTRTGKPHPQRRLVHEGDWWQAVRKMVAHPDGLGAGLRQKLVRLLLDAAKARPEEFLEILPPEAIEGVRNELRDELRRRTRTAT